MTEKETIFFVFFKDLLIWGEKNQQIASKRTMLQPLLSVSQATWEVKMEGTGKRVKGKGGREKKNG